MNTKITVLDEILYSGWFLAAVLTVGWLLLIIGSAIRLRRNRGQQAKVVMLAVITELVISMWLWITLEQKCFAVVGRYHTFPEWCAPSYSYYLFGIFLPVTLIFILPILFVLRGLHDLN